jgi:hypothetical protein
MPNGPENLSQPRSSGKRPVAVMMPAGGPGDRSFYPNIVTRMAMVWAIHPKSAFLTGVSAHLDVTICAEMSGKCARVSGWKIICPCGEGVF